ncbi:MAG: hypothetical protein PWQ82_1295 [Thermosediminibacterales bacterium]|nr:hypothetical protein [Thermosediminibacterales bacterium]MDK2836515.1 hypothetical protein [Thermosediminibacterales bacterium]
MSHNRLSIIMPNLLTWDGKKPVTGGLERYVWNLLALLKEMGISPDVHQNGSFDWEREVNGINIRGYGMARIAIEAAIQEIHGNTDRVFYASIIYHPTLYKPDSVVISHGVWWDSSNYDPVANLAICRQALEQAKTVVSCDYNFLNVMRATLPTLSHKIEVIPNFADLELFKPRQALKVKDGGDITILFPRRLDICRGIDLFLNAGIRIVKKHPGVKLHLAVDTNHPEFNRVVNEYINSTQEKNRIITGSYSFEDMPEVYATADIVVIPSIFSEGTSFSCLEAMASGCTLVVTNVGGLTNLIIDGYNGLIIKPDENELVHALETLIANPRLRLNLSRNARSVAESFSLNLWKERWRKIIREVYPDLVSPVF